MSVVYSATLKDKRMQLVIDYISGKTASASSGSPSAGSLVIGTSSLSGATGVLATIPLSATPFTLSSGVITLADVPLEAEASAPGTAAKAELRDNGGNVIVSGLTVSATSGDIIIGSTTIGAAETVRITAGTITHG